MKRLWIAFLLLIIVLSLGIGSLLLHRSILTDLTKQLTMAEQAVRSGDKEDALQKTRQFQQNCEKADPILDVLSRHEQTLPLQQSAYLLTTLLDDPSDEPYYAEAARCRFYLQELLAEEQPAFSNIF